MKHYYFLLFLFFFYCSCSTSNSNSQREKAIAKQTEAVNVFFDVTYKNRDADSLQLAMTLIDESIAIDTTWLVSYQTKVKFLNINGKYEEALNVLELAFNRQLEKEYPDLFILRGIQYDKLNQSELALADYKAAFDAFDTKIKENPNDIHALSAQALLVILSEDTAQGFNAYEKILAKSIEDTDRAAIEMFIKNMRNMSRDEIIELFY